MSSLDFQLLARAPRVGALQRSSSVAVSRVTRVSRVPSPFLLFFFLSFFMYSRATTMMTNDQTSQSSRLVCFDCSMLRHAWRAGRPAGPPSLPHFILIL